MDKIYLLLRNNKETGPYAIDELAKLNLKPTDLIWVEGKSAGWRNPMEIDDLRFYLEDLSEQPAINAEYKQIYESETPVVVPVATESSNIKKPSKSIFVSLPEGLQPDFTSERRVLFERPVSAEISDTEKVDVQTTAEKLDKKAQELLEKMQAYAKEKSSEKIESHRDIRYAPPLNDSREESSDSREEPLDWKQSINFSGDLDNMEVKENEPEDKFNSSLNENRNYGDWRKQPRPVEKKVIRKKPILVGIGLLVLLAFGIIRRSGKES
ncbi:MAG TPA: hypothetical protein VNA26_09665, partial [Chitinophagaceae bacterium]|nr:hypothetical protein [Chitinophagaceae bacterium]